MIDLSRETAVSVADVPGRVPGRPHVSTVWRWINSGVRGARLETITVGARRYTTQEAISRFIQATTAATNGEPQARRTPRQRQRGIERAEADVAQAGI